MSTADLIAWLAEMKAVGRASTDAECAKLLDIQPTMLGRWKRGEVAVLNHRTALACAALLWGLEPYPVRR